MTRLRRRPCSPGDGDMEEQVELAQELSLFVAAGPRSLGWLDAV